MKPRIEGRGVGGWRSARGRGCVFFFQAEDGIRDLTVTGVQTCALPISVVDHKPKYLGRLGKELNIEAGRDAAYTAALNVLAAAKEHLGSLDKVTRVVRRSEERRVGKECRSRWSPYH